MIREREKAGERVAIAEAQLAAHPIRVLRGKAEDDLRSIRSELKEKERQLQDLKGRQKEMEADYPRLSLQMETHLSALLEGTWHIATG
ncbi:MAG: hypothetical protein A4E41_01601 [Methanoregulaceae archaeon PtaU1.Bin066]|nr:MAG: hypothetical protein A4E41_01601 [Methanoregulaceae archaeon PtaU1.Bin066]